MRNILIAFTLIFLSGCSLNRLVLSEEIDKINVVKYQTYLKQHRAYFKRDNLKLISAKDKYLCLYHAEKKELSILLRRKNIYTLYNFTNLESPNMTLSVKEKTSYKKLLRYFSRLGYKPANLTNLGYHSKVAFRRYKGVKTLMVEIKDYSRLKQIYEKAIRTYQSKDIMSIKTRLPKTFIYSYFQTYKAQAKTPEQLKELQYIATKLRFDDKIIETPEEDEGQDIFSMHNDDEKGYYYYLHRAPVNELKRYLSKSSTKSSLTPSEYQDLSTHLAKMKEENLFTEGSLEELIAAYKVNKDPKYKQRIMALMKETQNSQ